MTYRYSLGLGSNVSPEQKLTAIINALRERFGRIHLSRVCWTHPVGVDADDHYLNAVVQFESDMRPTDLKTWTKTLEQKLGRNYAHRHICHADIDILHISCDGIPIEEIDFSCDPWFLPLLSELREENISADTEIDTVVLELADGLSTGERSVWL